MGNRTSRKGAPLSAHSSKKQIIHAKQAEALSLKIKASVRIPTEYICDNLRLTEGEQDTEDYLAPPAGDPDLPDYSEEDAPSYFGTEEDFRKVAKKFDLAIHTKPSPVAQEKLLPVQDEKNSATFDLTFRTKPSSVAQEKPLPAQDEMKFAALDLAIRLKSSPKPSPKPAQQEPWFAHLGLYASQAAHFPRVPGVCTKDPVCTCGGVFEYLTDISEAYEELFSGNPSTKSHEERIETFRVLSRFRAGEWCDWSNAHEEYSEDES